MTVKSPKFRQIMFFWVLLVAPVSLTAHQSLAAVPTLQECNKLDKELEDLKSQGVVEGLEKGPDWAKSNLPANRVNMILRYLKVYERVRFQCEDVFAEAEAIEMARKAKEAARLLALSNIPPPPEKRPKNVPKPLKISKKRYQVPIPPLPSRNSN